MGINLQITNKKYDHWQYVDNKTIMYYLDNARPLAGGEKSLQLHNSRKKENTTKVIIFWKFKYVISFHF